MADNITQEEYEERFAAIKDEVSVQPYEKQYNLSDYIIYLDSQLKKLRELQESNIITENTLLRECVGQSIMLAMSGSKKVFRKHQIEDVYKLTLKKLATIPKSELKTTMLTDYQLSVINGLFKKTGLKFI